MYFTRIKIFIVEKKNDLHEIFSEENNEFEKLNIGLKFQKR